MKLPYRRAAGQRPRHGKSTGSLQNCIKIILHQCSRDRQLFRHPDALLPYKVKWFLPFVFIVTCLTCYAGGDDSCLSSAIAIDSGVWQIHMKRESVSNAMGLAFWTELPEILNILFSQQDCRCIVLRGLGMMMMMGMGGMKMIDSNGTQSKNPIFCQILRLIFFESCKKSFQRRR